MTAEPGNKTFSMLENNPDVINQFASKIGLAPTLTFHEVYSFDEPSLLALIPRSVHALLVIIPWTPTWHATRESEDRDKDLYTGYGNEEPVIWFRQDIGNACGSIGALHCFINGGAVNHIVPDSALDKLRRDAVPLMMDERARMLHDSRAFEEAHRAVEMQGSGAVPTLEEQKGLKQHFVAFVKGRDGHLWELEGSRKGPIDRGLLAEDEDVLSPRALDLGIRSVIRKELREGQGDLRFSCLALCDSGS
ncbi:Ubiquitin carboxyl-terminal hydrolase isozyme L3 [Sphaceloma murrayae]|uniref:Ubiquitin carboxyl-terminal hydrolase n=1 Tax=Sphaceloma murrayae TaxID=2082308 RepID=A0A2K1R3V3_9PEZI|nr:Ubiquitin carboxyl-terminal hydrolase isozyme L3 [Sphaceloma murrayae]